MRATLIVLVLLVAWPARASGDVGVVVIGEATMQPALAAQLETWLRTHGHQLVASPLPPEAINTLIDCFVIEDEMCARKVVQKRSKSQAVVFARVELQAGAAKERTVTLTAYWFDKGGDAVAERRFCERCTDLTLRSTADDLMAALAGAGQKDIGHLKITSEPSSARVSVDGKPVGVTPVDVGLATGNHRVTLSYDGHTTETREITIKRGELANLEVGLERDRNVAKVVPMALIGIGGAAILTGAVLIAIDQDAGDVGMDDEFFRNTGPAGVGTLIGGAVIGGVGGYLFYRSRSRESAPIAAITSDSAYIGWAGRF